MPLRENVKNGDWTLARPSIEIYLTYKIHKIQFKIHFEAHCHTQQFFFSLKSVGMIPCILIRQPMTSTILLCVLSYNSGKVNLLPHKKYIYLLPYEDTLVILVVRLPPGWGLLSCHHADTLNQIRLVSLKAHRIFLHITICKHMLPHHYIQCISPTRDCVPLWGRNHVSFMSSTILNE